MTSEEMEFEISQFENEIAKLEDQIEVYETLLKEKAREQKPCEDTISRQIISEYVKGHIQEINAGYGDLNSHTNRILRMIVDYIENMPKAGKKQKAGHWTEDIDNNRLWDRVRFYCSECGDWQTYGKTEFCPCCGARMESEG